LPSNLYSSELEREVQEAMTGMSAEELMEVSLVEPFPHAPGTDDLESKMHRARIVGAHKADVFLDLGGKAQGVVPRGQFGAEDPVTVGRMIEVLLVRYESEDGLWICSREGAVQEARWDTLRPGMIVEGKVTGLNKGGLEVNLHGIRGFMPASHVDPKHIKDISVFLTQTIQCEVLEVNRRERNVLVSRRKYLEKAQREERERIEAELAPDQVRKGVVSNITDFGAFVDLGGGLDGLIHIRELAWGQVEKVADVVEVGQTVEVVVLKIDKEHKRISLSLRKALQDPWTCMGQKYAEGTQVKARIVRIQDFGAFAELEPGIEALIPISELSWTGRVRHPKDVVEVGQMVDAVVTRLEMDKRKAALSMKRVATDPWEGVFESFPKDSLVTGTVMRLADFGAFVQITAGVEGLVHISEISSQRVKSTADALQVGQEVKARVLNVDRAQRRISLSIKAADESMPTTESASPADEKARKKKRAKPLRGGLTTDWDWQGHGLRLG